MSEWSIEEKGGDANCDPSKRVSTTIRTTQPGIAFSSSGGPTPPEGKPEQMDQVDGGHWREVLEFRRNTTALANEMSQHGCDPIICNTARSLWEQTQESIGMPAPAAAVPFVPWSKAPENAPAAAETVKDNWEQGVPGFAAAEEREALRKIGPAIGLARKFFHARDAMNAAVHNAEERLSPITVAIDEAHNIVMDALYSPVKP